MEKQNFPSSQQSPHVPFQPLSPPQEDVPSQLLVAQSSFALSCPLCSWNRSGLLSLASLCIIFEIQPQRCMSRKVTHPHRVQYSIRCGNRNAFISSTVDGHLGAVWPGVTMTKTARNTLCSLVHVCTQHRLEHDQEQACWAWSVFSFRKYSQTMFQNGGTSYTNTSRIGESSRPHQLLGLSIF